MTLVLKILNVDCSYGATKALNGLSFSINQGSFTGIIGPNGSGKSTLLRCISRVLKPESGTVIFNEQNLYSLDLSEVAKKMAVVPQETSVNFSFTAKEIVLMGRTPHLGRFQREGPKDYEIVQRVMELTNTLYLADRPITAVSGGERQRVIIAKALAQDPRIILLDEPTSHLDINHQVEILSLLRRLNRESGVTIVAVFHDLNLAAQYCDNLILMKEGQVFTMGGPEEVLTSENIKEVYGASVLIKKHPVTGLPTVLLISRESGGAAKKGRVHVVCGGGEGASVLGLLVNQGYKVSTGVLNVGDIDWETAKFFELDLAEETPFCSISEKSHRDNLELIKNSDACIMVSIPFGLGNLRNLEAVSLACDWGIPVLLVEEREIGDRDFTGGTAAKIYNEVKKKGAAVFQRGTEILDALPLILSEKNNLNQ